MLTKIYNPNRNKEDGFTLIELLVVVAIIGILAAIAIPVFLNQRNSARNASVESDLRNVATVLETAYTTNGEYPAAATELTDKPYEAAISQGNVIEVVNNSASYTIAGCNFESGTIYYYDSSAGGFVDAIVGLTPPICTEANAGRIIVS